MENIKTVTGFSWNTRFTLSNIQAIKKFFGEGECGRVVDNSEIKAFINDIASLRELGELCRKVFLSQLIGAGGSSVQ